MLILPGFNRIIKADKDCHILELYKQLPTCCDPGKEAFGGCPARPAAILQEMGEPHEESHFSGAYLP